MLIDSHTHLDRYGDSLKIALEEIRRKRIFTISNSMDLPSYRRNLEIAEHSDLVLPTFGVHPRNAPDYDHRLTELGKAIEQSPMIGEIGLDYHWVEDASQYPAQRKVLEFFLVAAKEQTKIVNLHTKGAEEEILKLLTHYEIQRPIVHWYSGPLDVFRAMVKRGTYFTIGVEVLYSEHIRTIARELPIKQLLTETDNPGGLKWLKGNLGMPRALEAVIQAIAELREMTAEVLGQTVHENFLRLIENDPWLSEVRDKLSQVRAMD